MRKLRKAFKSPLLFLRDALLKKHPLILNQNNIHHSTEKIIIESLEEIQSSFEITFPIDLVYSWVDASDENWLDKKRSYEETSKHDKFELYAKEDSRFVSHDEIYYSLKSVEKYMPWVNKIYIVTDRQKPKIPESISKKVLIIDHKDIIPEQFLPTFNSHVIECYIHKIPNLSEHFVYLNDDFFVARPLKPQHFFNSNKIANLFISNKKLDIMSNTGRPTATLSACNNCNSLLKSKFHVHFNNTLVHTYVPLKKSLYEFTFNLFKQNIAIFSKNRFRSSNDLNLATFMVPYIQYQHGHSIPSIDICFYFNVRSPAANLFYKTLLTIKGTPNAPHSFCANDFSSNEFKKNDYHIRLKKFLKDFFDEI